MFDLQPEESKDVQLVARRIYQGEKRISTGAVVLCGRRVFPKKELSVEQF